MARYSPEQRERALAIYVAIGPKAAAAETEIPANTIKSWARREGLSTSVTPMTHAATEASAARAEQRRAVLREEFIAKAGEVLERMSRPHVEIRVLSGGRDEGSRVEMVETDLPPASAVRDYAVSVGILLDKYRLEMGEDTNRTSITSDVTLRQVPDEQLNAALGRVLAKLEEKG